MVSQSVARLKPGTIFVQGTYTESNNAPVQQWSSDYTSITDVDLWKQFPQTSFFCPFAKILALKKVPYSNSILYHCMCAC